MNNKSEHKLSNVHAEVFLKEFTFSNNKFYSEGPGSVKELADNIVWLDNIVLLIQLKEREDNNVDENYSKWFVNKIKNKAVSQIKDTFYFLNSYENLIIKNDYGHSIDMSKIDSKTAIKIIIYDPKVNSDTFERFQKFHNSSTLGLIHLFHIEDYFELLKILITPAEIKEYLDFRTELYQLFPNECILYPEQLLLGHYLGNEPFENFGPNQIEYLLSLKEENQSFEFMSILKDFNNRQIQIEGSNEKDYYEVVKEIAKLKRNELKEFKKHFIWAFESCKTDRFDLPSRLTIPRTKIGFIFIPINRSVTRHWEDALLNFTNLHCYDQKLDKCIGVAIFQNPNNSEFIEIMWSTLIKKWQYDQIIEDIIKNIRPLSAVQKVDLVRYNFECTKNTKHKL